MAVARTQSNTKKYDQTRMLRTAISVKEKHLRSLLDEATEHAIEAKQTGDEHHLREAVRLRDSAAHLASSIEVSRRRLETMAARP